MIVVCDINEIWRIKPFAAMAGKTDVLGVSPMDWVTMKRRGFQRPEAGLEILNVALPPGWASRTARIGQRMLWGKIEKAAGTVSALVVTSPHYLPMLDLVPPEVKLFYYASDDYRSYEGWADAAANEGELIRRVEHTFFVSEGLMRRAETEYGVASVSVSMNASEPRFYHSGPAVDPPVGEMDRPIAGIIGGINERLDFSLLSACADIPELGTLLLVGPIPEQPNTELKKLLEHPKVKAVGRQPHETIHRWFQCLDVGLIPYAATEFNRLCSPMRLFDHLASGSPVVSTSACEQPAVFPQQVTAADGEHFAEAVRSILKSKPERIAPKGIIWNDRADEMLKLMKEKGVA